jgi:hypothetical protein
MSDYRNTRARIITAGRSLFATRALENDRFKRVITNDVSDSYQEINVIAYIICNHPLYYIGYIVLEAVIAQSV